MTEYQSFQSPGSGTGGEGAAPQPETPSTAGDATVGGPSGPVQQSNKALASLILGF